MAGIYVHIPFCSQACHYCDFHFSVNRTQAGAMVKAIAREAQLRNAYPGTEKIKTLYFGGGTPSILSNEQLAQLFEAIYENYSLEQKAEITLEANPEDISLTRLQYWRSLGINRLSIGIQSFQPDMLKWMNRVHSAQEAEKSVLLAQDAGFENLTIDLMYGMPNLLEDDWQINIQKAIDLQVPHISAYQLTIEPKTVFGLQHAKGLLKESPDQYTEMQFDTLKESLIEAGIEQYEISNFAKEGFQSRHNSNYWEGVPYLGLGPSAHSFKDFQRDINPSSNGEYLQKLAQGIWPGIIESLSPTDRANEMLLTGLRTVKGTNTFEILKKTGVSVEQTSKIDGLIRDGFMQKPTEPGQLQLTKAGLKLADRITLELWLEAS